MTTVPTAPALATIRGVEIGHAGQWDISTGTSTFTSDDWASAVGALDCPAIRRPLLKIGHVDPRFDGEPAIGWIDNLAADGALLSGDYVGIPRWLADVMASAYPDRSLEALYDVRCQIGHTHPFVLTAVALLGVSAPGIGTLESLQDVATLFGVAATAQPQEAIVPNPNPRTVAAGVSTEDVRRAYYADAPWSVWITEIELDPLQLITCDDDTGDYARVPVIVAGDEVTFGDAVTVVVKYEDKPASVAAGTPQIVQFATRAESRPGSKPSAPADPKTPVAATVPGSTTTPGKEPAVVFTDEQLTTLRQKLGVPEDADEAAILAAVETLGTPAEADPITPEPPGGAHKAEPIAASGKIPAGSMIIDADTLASLQEQGRQGAAAAARLASDDRDRAISAAIQDGKFAPAREAHWKTAWDHDPEGTKQALASMPKNLVPIAPVGQYGDPDATDMDAEFASIFPPTGTGA